MISQGPHDLGTIFWYKGNRHFNLFYDNYNQSPLSDLHTLRPDERSIHRSNTKSIPLSSLQVPKWWSHPPSTPTTFRRRPGWGWTRNGRMPSRPGYASAGPGWAIRAITVVCPRRPKVPASTCTSSTVMNVCKCVLSLIFEWVLSVFVLCSLCVCVGGEV